MCRGKDRRGLAVGVCRVTVVRGWSCNGVAVEVRLVEVRYGMALRVEERQSGWVMFRQVELWKGTAVTARQVQAALVMASYGKARFAKKNYRKES